jgi:hypothetical protein
MLDKSKIAVIQADLAKAMREVAAKHGLKMGASKALFTDVTFKLTAEFALIEAMGGAQFSPELVAHLTKWGHNWGLSTEMLGTEFETDRGTMVFHGTRGTSTKYLIAAVKATGDKFRYPIGEPASRTFIQRIITAHAAK